MTKKKGFIRLLHTVSNVFTYHKTDFDDYTKIYLMTESRMEFILNRDLSQKQATNKDLTNIQALYRKSLSNKLSHRKVNY